MMKKYSFVAIFLMCFLTLFVGCYYQANMDDALLLQQEGKNTATQGDGLHETFQPGCEMTCCLGNSDIDFYFEYTNLNMYPGEEYSLSFGTGEKSAVIDYDEILIDVSPQHILDVLQDENRLIIRALLKGEAVITARYRGQETKCTVSVRNNVDLILSSYYIDLFPREKEYLTYVLLPPGLGPVLVQLDNNAFVHMQHIPEDNTIVLTGYEIGETALFIEYNGVREQVKVVVHSDNFPYMVLDTYELAMVPGDNAIIQARLINAQPEDYFTQLKWRIDESSSRIVKIVPSGDNRAAYIFALEPGRVKVEAVFSYPFMPESESIIRVCWITVGEHYFDVSPKELDLLPNQVAYIAYQASADITAISYRLDKNNIVDVWHIPDEKMIKIQARDIDGEVNLLVTAGRSVAMVTIRVHNNTSFEVFPTHLLVLKPGQIESLNYAVIPDVPLDILLSRQDLIHYFVISENREIRIEALENGITGEVTMYILARGVGARQVTIRVQS
jgi:hypothetical protein